MEKLEYLTSDKLKIKILHLLIDKKSHSPSELSIELNTNAITILRNSKFLELLDFINIDVKETNKNYFYLKLTSKGYNFYQQNRDKIDNFLK